jgi:sporulation protein YlmC with PRC-barrel domain
MSGPPRKPSTRGRAFSFNQEISVQPNFSQRTVALAALLALAGAGAAQAAPQASSSSAPPAASSNQPAEQAPAVAMTGDSGRNGATDNEHAAESGGFITRQKSSQVLSGAIIGMAVRTGATQDAKEIGKVTNLILDTNHKLAGIVVGVGGFLGVGEKDVGIPWSDVVQIDPKEKTVQVNLTRDQLESAPAFASNRDQRQSQQARQDRQDSRGRPYSAPVPPPAVPGQAAPVHGNVPASADDAASTTIPGPAQAAPGTEAKK